MRDRSLVIVAELADCIVDGTNEKETTLRRGECHSRRPLEGSATRSLRLCWSR